MTNPKLHKQLDAQGVVKITVLHECRECHRQTPHRKMADHAHCMECADKFRAARGSIANPYGPPPKD